MSIPRFHCPGLASGAGRVDLPPDAAHHAAKVLRLQKGAEVVVFDGRGGEYPGVVVAAGKPAITVELGPRRERERESPLDIVLAQGISAGDKMDFTLQKAVELGISAIQPIACERSVVKLSGERADKRVRHWQQVVVAACEQCGRNRVPEVRPILGLDAWLSSLEGTGQRLALAPEAALALRDLPPPASRMVLLVGPEGGLSPGENRAAAAQGFTPVRLGPRVLRTETAALAALAAIQTLWGDF